MTFLSFLFTLFGSDIAAFCSPPQSLPRLSPDRNGRWMKLWSPSTKLPPHRSVSRSVITPGPASIRIYI
jgi:hypothetical protein